MLQTIFEHGIIYYLWLLTLSLAFAQSIILVHLYLKSKGTPIGRLAFYISLSSLMWSIATAVYAVSFMQAAETYIGAFLFVASAAGITSTLGAYERARIQGILTPTGERDIKECRVCRYLGVLVLAIAIFEIGVFVSRIALMNLAIESFSFVSALGFLFIAASLIALTQPKFPAKLAYIGVGIALIMAFLVLIGHLLGISALHELIHVAGAGEVSTSVGLIVASFGVISLAQRGLKAWIVKINFATNILVIAALAVPEHIFYQPTIYSEASFATLSIPATASFFFLGLALLWAAWKQL